MDRPSQESGFCNALRSLETCLETPRVSGELEPWLVDVQKNVDLIGSLLPRQLERQHASLLRQIAVEDPELRPQVAHLESGDAECREQFGKLRDWTSRLAKGATNAEPDETRLEQEVVAFIAGGLAFIIHARKQEVAIETWLHESLYRDTGVSG
jgi:hypothetical protein